MREFTMAQIDSHMANLIGRMEKYQISDVQFSGAHRAADPNLQCCGAWQLNVEQFKVNLLNKPRTVDPTLVIAAHFVWCPGPAADCGAELLFRRGCRLGL